MIADIETDTVTLFGTGKKCRDWGFYDDDGKFIPWQELPGAE